METSISTGELVADTNIVSRPGVLTAILVITDGTNAAKAVIYDNVAASGKVLGEWTVPGATQYGGRNWVVPVRYEIGMFLDITGTGASAIVEYV